MKIVPWPKSDDDDVSTAESDSSPERFILCRSQDRSKKEEGITQRFEKKIETALTRMKARCEKQARDPMKVEREIGSMFGKNYAHWHGMYEVAERFYQELIPQAREIAHQAEEAGQTAEAEAVRKVIEDLLNRPEHTWYEEMKTTLKKGVEDHAAVAVPGHAVVGDVAEAAQGDAAKVDTIDSASSDGDTAAAASPTEPITPSTESP